MPSRWAAVTGPIRSSSLLSGAPDWSRNTASTVAESACVSKPPSKPESVACIRPASIAAAYVEMSTVCVPDDRDAPGPPAKKFLPEPETGKPDVP